MPVTATEYLEKVDQMRHASGQIDYEKLNFDILIKAWTVALPRGANPLEQISGVFHDMLFEKDRMKKTGSTDVLANLVVTHPKIAKLVAECFEFDVIFYTKMAENPSKKLAEEARKMASMA